MSGQEQQPVTTPTPAGEQQATTQPAPPAAAPPAAAPPAAAPPADEQNQGIPYQLRRIQIIDAVILSAIIAVFAITYEVRDEVRDMRAEKEAEDKIDAEFPPIRRVQFDYEMSALREKLRTVGERVTELEDSKPE